MLIASVGCGSRKVEKQNVVSESVEFKQFASVDTTEIKTNTAWNSDYYSIEPIDNSIPMVIGGKSYSNVRIKKEKASAVTNVIEKKGMSEKASYKVNSKVVAEIKVADKKGLSLFNKISIFIIAIGSIFIAVKITSR